MAASVEGKEVRALAHQPSGHLDLVRIGGEVDQGASLEAEQRDAGIAVPLGSSRQERSGPTELYQWGIGGASFALEPMVGRLFFDNTQLIEDQDIAGMRAGFDMGRLLGLRGFYWRGTSSNSTDATT